MTATLQERLTNRVVAELTEKHEQETLERWQRRRALALLVLNSEADDAEQPDVEYVADELKAVEWDNETLFAEVDRLRKCRELAELAKQEPAMSAELRRVEAELKTTNEELGRIIKEHRAKLDSLSQQQAVLLDKRGRAIQAQGDLPNLMELPPDVVRREREIADEFVRLGEVEKELQERLKESRPHWLNSTMTTMADREPGVVIAESRNTLADSSATHEQRKRAEQRLSAALAAKQQIDDQLAQVARRRERLQQESRKFYELKMQGV